MNTDTDNKSRKWLYWLLVVACLGGLGTYVGWANVYDFAKQAILTMGSVALLFGPH